MHNLSCQPFKIARRLPTCIIRLARAERVLSAGDLWDLGGELAWIEPEDVSQATLSGLIGFAVGASRCFIRLNKAYIV